MTDFLKKYWLNILAVLVLTTLLLYFIPNEETRYFQPDIDVIKMKSHSVLLWAEIILFVSLFILGLRRLKKIDELFNLIFGLGLFALTFFFLFDSIFLSATLFINKLSKSETVDKKYNAVYIDKDNKSLLLWDSNLKKSIQADRLLNTLGKQNINVTDTVIVSFTNGLLGFNYDPKIKAIKNTAASGAGR